MSARAYRGWRAIGRLKPGVTIDQAQSEAGVIAAGLAAQFPDENKDMGIGVKLLHESIVGNLRPTLLLLLGAVGFVLLIACVNVANLLFERGSAGSGDQGAAGARRQRRAHHPPAADRERAARGSAGCRACCSPTGAPI